jgi:hypothetical protein
MLVGQQNEICGNGYAIKGNLHAQFNPCQIFNYILHRYKKINPKIHVETQKTKLAKVILTKMSNAGGSTIPDLKLYYGAIKIKTSWYWYKKRHEDK